MFVFFFMKVTRHYRCDITDRKRRMMRKLTRDFTATEDLNDKISWNHQFNFNDLIKLLGILLRSKLDWLI